MEAHMPTAEIQERLITIEEFFLMPDDGRPTELVRGRIVPMNVPAPRHGYFCALIVRLLGEFVWPRDTGRIMSNDSGVITERDPDTLRGADVSYNSYEVLPRGPLPEGYLEVSPDVIFEVRSPTDRWADTLDKVQECLKAGVKVVCVLDPRTESLTVYDEEGPPRVLHKVDVLTLPTLLPGFELPIARLFE
jgi:Uma2 family endonuclease